MFESHIYRQRRELLKKDVKSGLIILPGNNEIPMNYPANPLPYRQDSSFLYFFGLASPGLAGIIDAESGEEMLFGNDVDMEDIIWMGPQPMLADRAQEVGISITHPYSSFGEYIRKAEEKGRKIHYLPVYGAAAAIELSGYMNGNISELKNNASEELIRAVIKQREIKIPEEIAQMEEALNTSYEMYIAAMKMTRPGLIEREIVGKMEGIAASKGCLMAFPTILTVNGQILHNHYHGNRLEGGQLLVIDSGAESPMNYASDITRTIPVKGIFSQRERDIYEVVLAAQVETIKEMKPGMMNRENHLKAAKIIARGLKDLGLMKGNIEDAVAQGAHAMFFPHGLGHMIGLDVHDMEGLGEDFVGYDQNVQRSDQFGLAYLRLAKELKPGHVITVEPGIYFIPALIDKWESEGLAAEYINYDKMRDYREFGGIRIEDDVLITEKGFRILGREIPKTVEEVESAMMS